MRSQVGGGTHQAALLASVSELVHASWWNVDHENGDGGETFFRPDGICEMPAMTMSGRPAIAEGGYAARRAAATACPDILCPTCRSAGGTTPESWPDILWSCMPGTARYLLLWSFPKRCATSRIRLFRTMVTC